MNASSITRFGIACAALMSVSLTIPMSTAIADDDRHKPQRWVLPGNAVFPEGIAVDEDSGTFFVGSTTDGTIFTGNANSSNEASVFLAGGDDGRTDVRGMKMAKNGRLYVSGGALGKVFVYDIASKALLASFATGLTPSFVNDVTIAPNGDAYFTDSQSPAIYRLSADLSSFTRFTDFVGSSVVYGPGFNLNGIAATADGAYVITVQSNTGKLIRVDLASKQVLEINLDGANAGSGDGILLKGRTLHLMRNSLGLLLTFKLSDDFTSADLRSVTTDGSFQFPTTFGRYRNRFIVVNSQFNNRAAPVLPFNVSAINVPDSGNGNRLQATLTGAAEVGGGDADGSGMASIRLRPNKNEICFRIEVKDITLPAAAAHIHVGNAGANGPVVVDFNAPPDAKGRTKGCVAAAQSLINSIWSNPGGYYVNVHNVDFPGGAVRGHLAQEPLSQRGERDNDDKDDDDND